MQQSKSSIPCLRHNRNYESEFQELEQSRVRHCTDGQHKILIKPKTARKASDSTPQSRNDDGITRRDMKQWVKDEHENITLTRF